MRIVVVRPAYDKATHLCHSVANAVIDKAHKTCEVVDLAGRRATRCRLEACLDGSGDEPVVLVIYAHGPSEDEISGHCRHNGDEAELGDMAAERGGEHCSHRRLLDMANVDVLQALRVVAIACNCGRGLGKAAPKAAGAYFLGFTDEIYLPFGTEEVVGNCLNAPALAAIESPDEPLKIVRAMQLAADEAEDRSYEVPFPQSAALALFVDGIRTGLVLNLHDGRAYDIDGREL